MNSIHVARKPLIHITDSTSQRMWLVSSMAGLVILQSAISDNWYSLLIAVSALLAAILMELAINGARGNFTLHDGSAVTTALVLTLLLPNSVNPVIAILSALFAIGIVKHAYGGLGSNWLNPALGGWLFASLSWPTNFEQALDGSALQRLYQAVERGLIDPSGSPLAILKIAGYKVSTQDSFLTNLFNNVLFSRINAELPAGYLDFFAFTGPGIIADRGIGFLIIGTIIITATRINKPIIPAVYIGVYVLLVRLFGAIPFGGVFGNGDMLFALLNGGIILSAFILAADPATGTKSYQAGILTAAIAAILGFLFRFFGGAPFGALYGIMVANALVPAIRHLEIKLLYTNRR